MRQNSGSPVTGERPARSIGDDWWRLFLPGITSDVFRILAARAVRAFADGFVSVLLPIYLLELGFSVLSIGSLITATLVGSAFLTIWAGFFANRHKRRRLLLAACLLMAATGVGFALTTQFWPLFIIAFVGTINPSSGDVSLFLPLEQTILAQAIEPTRRTALFARYSLVGTLAGGIGVVAASMPDLAAQAWGWSHLAGTKAMFAIYGVLGLLALFVYQPLTQAVEATHEAQPAPLLRSRRIVYGLAALFSLDSFGSGFFVQSLLALWLYQTFDLSVTTAASILFWSSIFSAISFLLAVPISERFGLVNTMVFTHLPANIFLMLLPFAPNLATAIGLLLARSALSQMDVPTRTSYVMSVVTPQERPAAASLTAVPRSFASALSPLLAGYLMSVSAFGWPLVIGGALKAVYDLLLLAKFQSVRPAEELGAPLG
ncbi:MAG: MFS transporter [Hyphomicrobiales bacterium]|nr:MFS transporter [Hyphomicrobiales bacterium]